MLQDGNECGKSKGDANLTATPYRLRKIKDNWKMWTISTIWVAQLTTQDIQVKLSPGLSWQKQHSTRIGIFSIVNWT
jgi:hypothetical protein